MVLLPSTAYASWRAAALDASFLRETREGAPSEHLLQLVWQHQRLRAEGLTTLDGRPLRILHPGFWNRGAGPDFRDAVIRVGTDPPLSGDVEIDLTAGDWRAHCHDGNPAYHRVILHVIWQEPSNQPTPKAGALPVLAVSDRLDAPIDELMAWVDLDPGLPDNVIGRCAAGLRRLPESFWLGLLHQAARFRFERKGRELAARARQTGWEQTLWEALCGGLGYRNNVWPMRRLAELRTLLLEREPARDLRRLQAGLLGISGLLPHESPKKQHRRGDPYLRHLWDLWWRERHAFAEVQLPRSLWRLDGIRPANHPQRRVALAAHWLVRDDLVRRLEQWLAEPAPDSRLASTLLACLQGGEDPFWSTHWTLVSEAMPSPRPLLGVDRASDLAVNIILPWLWVRADLGGNRELQDEISRRFQAWPASQDNAVLRLARMRLFAGAHGNRPWTATEQQGLLQVVRDFCGHSNALCDACVFPERIRQCVADTAAPERTAIDSELNPWDGGSQRGKD